MKCDELDAKDYDIKIHVSENGEELASLATKCSYREKDKLIQEFQTRMFSDCFMCKHDGCDIQKAIEGELASRGVETDGMHFYCPAFVDQKA